MRRDHAVVTRFRRKPERLQNPQAFLGDRPRIDIDALVERRREFLQHQRDRGRDRALGMDGPDIDSRGPLRLPRHEGHIGIARIEAAVEQPARTFVRQRQHRQETLARRRGDVEIVFPCDGPEGVRVVVRHRLNDSIGGQAGDVFPCGVHQGGNAGGIDGKNHRPPGHLHDGHLIQRTRGSRCGTSPRGFANEIEVKRGHHSFS